MGFPTAGSGVTRAWNAKTAQMKATQPKLSEFLTFAQAARLLPRRRNGRPCSPSTLWRWHRNGLDGVFLAAWRVGATWCTTEAAIQEFVVARQDNLRTDEVSDDTAAPAGVEAALRRAGIREEKGGQL